jgi:hypothetical protein
MSVAGAAALSEDLRMAGGEVALSLYVTRGADPGGDGGGGLAGGRADHVGGGDGRDIDADIDAIEEGTRDAALVIGATGVAALAGVAGRAGETAFAGVHRGDELEARWEGDARIGAGDHRFTALERLAQAIEHTGRELGQLVEK